MGVGRVCGDKEKVPHSCEMQPLSEAASLQGTAVSQHKKPMPGQVRVHLHLGGAILLGPGQECAVCSEGTPGRGAGQRVGQGWLRGEQVSSQTLKCWALWSPGPASQSLRMWPWDPFLGVSLGWF